VASRREPYPRLSAAPAQTGNGVDPTQSPRRLASQLAGPRRSRATAPRMRVLSALEPSGSARGARRRFPGAVRTAVSMEP